MFSVTSLSAVSHRSDKTRHRITKWQTIIQQNGLIDQSRLKWSVQLPQQRAVVESVHIEQQVTAGYLTERKPNRLPLSFSTRPTYVYIQSTHVNTYLLHTPCPGKNGPPSQNAV